MPLRGLDAVLWLLPRPTPTSNAACQEGAGRSRPGTASPTSPASPGGQSRLRVLICIPGGEGAPAQLQQPLIWFDVSLSLLPRQEGFYPWRGRQPPPSCLPWSGSGSDSVCAVGTEEGATLLLILHCLLSLLPQVRWACYPMSQAMSQVKGLTLWRVADPITGLQRD